MTVKSKWLSSVLLLMLLIMAACGNPDSNQLPTQAPLVSIKDEEAAEPESDDTAEGATEEETSSGDTVASENDSDEDTAVDTTSDSEESDDELAVLPAIDQAQVASSASASGIGGGGGGGLTTESASLPATSDVAIDYVGIDIFDGTAFVLNTALPTEPNRAPVQQQSSFSLSLEDARAIASQFGFDGPIYQQPVPEGIEVIEAAFFSNVYFAFDDNGRTLNIDSFSTYYNDSSFQYDAVPNLTLEQAGPVAEAFLQERGLLDFEYVMEKGWGNEIWFKRVIRGAAVNQPEITVSVTNEGEILFVSVQRVNNMERLGNYPLRTAEEAWADLQTGVVENNISFSYVPDFDNQPIGLEVPFEGEYQYWQRTYAPGSTATVYTWPSVYVSADGSAPPRIEAYPFVLEGDAALLEEIAAQSFNQFRFEGVVGENGRVLQITNWESITDYPENLYLQGTAQVEDGQMIFISERGDIYTLPDAPEDLPTDKRLNVFAWETIEGDGSYPQLVWENIDLFVEFEEGLEEPVLLDDVQIFEPTVYETIVINNAELVYFLAYIFPETSEEQLEFQPPTILVKPVWQFTGEAENGDLINFYVDAVAAEFVE